MKKVIAVLMIMAIFSTAVFAAPLSVAGSLGTTSSEFSLAGQTSDGPDKLNDLFADVNAVPLTEDEALAVEGDGWITALVGGVITAAIVTVDLCQGNTDAASKHFAEGAATTAVAAAVIPF